jgi:signal transduction histidine kinase
MKVGDRLIREMVCRFDEITDRFDILSRIDQAILSQDLAMEDALFDILRRSKEHFRVKSATLFFITGTRVQPLSEADMRAAPVDREILRDECLISCEQVQLLQNDQYTVDTLLIPVTVGKVPSLRIIFAYQATWYGGEISRLREPDVDDFAKILSRQCSILASKIMEVHLQNAREKIIEAFFGSREDPEQCWWNLTKSFGDFLPKWGPLKLYPEPRIQVLTYDGVGDYILLRASGDDGRTTAKALLIERTICGMLIERQRQELSSHPLYVDPTEERFKDRFRAYLADETPRSELVVPIIGCWPRPNQNENGTIGMVNIEHPDADVFTETHFEILKIAASFAAPFVMSMLNEEEVQRHRDISMIYMLHRILHKMAKTYRHKVGQHLATITLSIEALDELDLQLDNEQKVFFDRLRRTVSSFAVLTRDFTAGLPNYVRFERLDLLPILNRAIEEFAPSEMKKAEDIDMDCRIDIDVDGSLDVFASELVGEHLYNLLHNSVDAVRERLKTKEIVEGHVSIRVWLKQQQDRRNTTDSYPFIVVSIEDNGGGMTSEIEEHIYEHGNSSKKDKDGHGFGIPAANEYMTAIGGLLHYENKPREGMRWDVCIPRFMEEVHVPMSDKLNFIHKA